MPTAFQMNTLHARFKASEDYSWTTTDARMHVDETQAVLWSCAPQLTGEDVLGPHLVPSPPLQLAYRPNWGGPFQAHKALQRVVKATKLEQSCLLYRRVNISGNNKTSWILRLFGWQRGLYWSHFNIRVTARRQRRRKLHKHPLVNLIIRPLDSEMLSTAVQCGATNKQAKVKATFYWMPKYMKRK